MKYQSKKRKWRANTIRKTQKVKKKNWRKSTKIFWTHQSVKLEINKKRGEQFSWKIHKVHLQAYTHLAWIFLLWGTVISLLASHCPIGSGSKVVCSVKRNLKIRLQKSQFTWQQRRTIRTKRSLICISQQ